MRKRIINAPDSPEPGAASFAQAVEVVAPERTLYFSAQIGTDATGFTPENFIEQARIAWGNVAAQLHAADMTLDDLVKVTIYLADRKYIADHRQVRLEVLKDRQVGLTAIFAGLFDDKWLIAIEGIAVA